jgi:predicted nucleotidyltransferase
MRKNPFFLEALDRLQALFQALELKGVVYLLGSSARGDAKRHSDIDLATEASDKEVLIRLRMAMEKLAIPYKVDLIDLSEADPEIHQAVQEEGMLLWKG